MGDNLQTEYDKRDALAGTEQSGHEQQQQKNDSISRTSHIQSLFLFTLCDIAHIALMFMCINTSTCHKCCVYTGSHANKLCAQNVIKY